MSKSEVLNALEERNREWEALLAEVGPARMEEAGVNGAGWSMKDMVAHLTGWNQRLAAGLEAALRGEAEPPPPWPAQLQTDDEINAWIYAANHARPAQEVLDESRRVYRQILAATQRVPEDARTERVEPAYYLVWVNGQRYQPGEFFDHFRDDHEPDVRAWLARAEQR